MAIAGIAVALVACAVSLLVLPATLALLGERVNALAPRRLQRAAIKDARPASSGAWYRLSRFVTRRPARIAAASAVLLITLGIPFHAIKFTASDASVLPQNSSVGHAYDVLESEFPPHRTEPIFLAIRAPAGKRVDDFADKLRQLPGVAQVKPPRPVSDRASLLEVVSNGRVLSAQSQDLVDEIRSLPTSLDIAVGGFTATFVDQKSSLSHHLPFAVAIVTTLTILLLFLMTGSLVLPLKALIMNLLTLSAVFGILVFVFQGGRLEGLLDYTGQGALDLTLPILLFAVAFGLATDYGVFLLTRIKEVRDSGVQDTEAVAIGLERTGRIVTSAALLFCVAVSVLVASQIVTIKQVGVGIILAVLIDATIVRAFLVPSLMRLLGSWNWWSPAPLRRLHRRLRLV
jgi:RND superfamily putative drug exporter